MSKPRILCSIDRAMGYGDAIMVHSTLKELAETYEVKVMCPDKSYGAVQLYGPKYNIEVFNVSQQGYFYNNDHVRALNLIYWDVFDSLRKLPYHAINCVRKIADLPLFDKTYNQELPEIPVDPTALNKLSRMIGPLKKPIIVVHPLISYYNKMMDRIKYRTILTELGKIGTIIQIGTTVPPEYKDPTAIDLIDKTTMEESIALIKLADVIFCGDTFLQHVAATLKTPSVVFYCGTTPMDFGYPFFSNLFYPDIATCQVKCGRPMRWLYDYDYTDKSRWETRGDAGWCCPIKVCDTAITVDKVIDAVNFELTVGRNRDWTFYQPELSDYIPGTEGRYRSHA